MPVFALSALLGYSVFFEGSAILFREIDVPVSVEEEGFTPKVVASRLASEVRAVNRAARTAKEQQKVGLTDDETAVKVVAEQFEFLKPIKATQEIMGLVTYTFGGEVVKLEHGYEFTVRGEDRKKGRAISVSAQGPRPEELIRPIAIDVARFIDPYIVASYYYETTRDAGGKDYADTLRELRNCMIVMPKEDRHWAVNLNGLVLLQQGKPEEAIEKFNEAKLMRADFVNPIYNTGLALAALGKHEEAIGKYKEVLAADAEKRTRYPHAYTQWGVSLAATGRPEEAVTMFRRAEQADPNFADLYNAWGKLLRDQGKQADAREMFQRAVDRVPERTEYRDNLKSVTPVVTGAVAG
ncbi:Tfp pilus assembly protein PilF [Azospirillum agricola]|nr:Tfp pilus assembly protein PilF [Azospirillum agricola]